MQRDGTICSSKVENQRPMESHARTTATELQSSWEWNPSFLASGGRRKHCLGFYTAWRVSCMPCLWPMSKLSQQTWSLSRYLSYHQAPNFLTFVQEDSGEPENLSDLMPRLLGEEIGSGSTPGHLVHALTLAAAGDRCRSQCMTVISDGA